MVFSESVKIDTFSMKTSHDLYERRGWGDCETWNKGELWLGYNFCNKNKSYKMTMEL